MTSALAGIMDTKQEIKGAAYMRSRLIRSRGVLGVEWLSYARIGRFLGPVSGGAPLNT